MNSPWLAREIASAHVDDLRRSAATGRIRVLPSERPDGSAARGSMRLRAQAGALIVRLGGRLGGISVPSVDAMLACDPRRSPRGA